MNEGGADTAEASRPRVGAWMQTRSGGRFYPLDPRPGDFEISDIAHALALEPRFGGQTSVPYTVAEHSVWVARRARELALMRPDPRTPADAALAAMLGLMHDASEAYLKDIPRPAKMYLDRYALMERQVQNAILTRFGLPLDDRLNLLGIVRRADEQALATEAHSFFARELLYEWELEEAPLAPVTPLDDWRKAEALFLEVYREMAEVVR